MSATPPPSATGSRSATPARSEALPLVEAAAAGLVAFGLCALLAPAVVNGDGLGYLRAAPTGERVPGHLAFLPLLRVVAMLAGARDALSLLGPARVLCWLSAAIAAAAVTVAAGRIAGRRAALVAGLGLAVSAGFLEAGADVESYAPALAAMCLALALAVERARGGGLGWSAAAAVMAAAAALLHVENVLFVPVVALATLPRTTWDAPPRAATRSAFVALLSIGGAATLLVTLAYAAAAAARGDDLPGALRWIRGASHGFSYPLGLASPFIALYGVAKTLIWAPYRYEASWPRVIASTTAGLLAAASMARLALRRDRLPGLAPMVTLAWAVPYAAVGLLFFASDSERWIFLLPVAWIAVGAGVASSSHAARTALALVATLLVANLAVDLPRAFDRSRRDRADAACAQLSPGDLVISPGHSWDEYVGFYRPLAIDHFPIIFFCGQLGGARPMAEALRNRAEWTRAAGHRVYLLRGDEPDWSPGWKDLTQFGVTPANLDGMLPGHRVAIEPGLERLDP